MVFHRLFKKRDSLAQLVEQLTFNQWVTGSSPVRVIADVAELADAPDLGSGALRAWGFKSLHPHLWLTQTALVSLAGLAQLVEHLICNQRVACSSHVAGIKVRM